jgi:RNA polymerase sigma-70 factor (ECF subfamily)
MDFRSRLTAELPYLRRFARGLARDMSLADDLVQDCLERALAKEHLYDPARQLRAWLYAILRNLHVSGLRRKGRAGVVKSVEDLAPEEEAVAGEQESTSGVRSIAEALDHLPDLHREIVLLVALEDMSYREVAEILGIPVGTVMSRLSRGRTALRSLLDSGERPALRRVK